MVAKCDQQFLGVPIIYRLHYLQDDVDTYIDIEKFYKENTASIVLKEPHLEQVKYTDEKEKSFPKIRTESYEGALKTFMNAKDMNDLSDYSVEITYFLKELGIYKRKNWAFQKEWRYLILISPMGLQEMNPLSLKKQQEQLRRIEGIEAKPVYDRLFLEIDPKVMKDIEIVFGPKMSEAEKTLAVALIKESRMRCAKSNSEREEYIDMECANFVIRILSE